MGRRDCQPCNQPTDATQYGGGGSCNNVANFNPNDFQRGGSCGTRDAGEVIRPEANAFAAPDQYDTAVKAAFQYTDQNYDQALKDAAAKGQPVVAVFGSKDTPDTQKLLATIAAAQKNGADGATYVYIDTDRVAQNPNSNLAKFVDQNIRGHNLAHTMMFTQRPDAAGNPIPESAMMTAWGGRDQIQATLRDHVKYGQDAMKGRQFNVVKPSDGAAPKADVVDQSKPAARSNADLLKDIQSGLEDGKKATNWKEGEQHYLKAVNAAKQVDQSAVKADMAKTQEALKVAQAKGDQTQVAELQKQADQLQTLQDAPWRTRMEFGLSCLKWNPNFRDVGEKWLLSAGDKNRSMYSLPEFRAGLRDAGYTAQDENRLATQMVVRHLKKENLIKSDEKQVVGPDGKPIQTPADKLNPPQQTDRQKLSDGRPLIIPDIRQPLRPPVKPVPDSNVKPPVRPDQTRPDQTRPDQTRPRPQDRIPHPEISNLQKIKEKQPSAQAEHDALVKAADEKLKLKAAWGATWCGYCPEKLRLFEEAADGKRDAVYLSNHDMNKSSLAHRVNVPMGSAPHFIEYNVQRLSENEFRVTPSGQTDGYIVRTNVRRKAS